VSAPRLVVALATALATVGSMGCASGRDCLVDPPTEAGDYTCRLAAYPDRLVDVHVPPQVTEGRELPVVLALHGGGGKRVGARRTTCPDGDENGATCLDAVADREGFIAVYPDGTSAAILEMRTWNAGGGVGPWRCVSGRACEENVDDEVYLSDVLDLVEAVLPVEQRRVYATGLSNGGAMSYRLGCTMADRIAAVAGVATGNQYATSHECAPSRPVPVLHIHGTADPCWEYEGGNAACLQDDGGRMISVGATIHGEGELEGWRAINGCDDTSATVAIDDASDDGTTASEERWSCAEGSAVVLITVEGGGHTWPQGWPYLDENRVGVVSQDFSATERIWTFFSSHALP